MTISGKSFLDLQSQREKLKEKTASNELSGGTATPPQPIQIKSSEAQTVSDALKNSKVQINPAIIQNNIQTKPTAVMTAGTPATNEEAQKAMKEILLEQRRKADKEHEGIYADHVDPNDMIGQAIQSFTNLGLQGRTKFITWNTQEDTDALKKGKEYIKEEYKEKSGKLEREKDTRQKFSNVYLGNYSKDIQINAFGPKFGIQNGISSLSWMNNYPNKWITNDGSEAMMTNGTTTISSPIIHIPDYEGDLATAYDTVTYAAAQDGVVVTPEYLKQNFPGFKDQPDQIVQNFIDDCLYDVQKGEKRPLEMYFNYYQGLSKSDKYVNKQDSIMELITDDDIIDNSIGQYVLGAAKMEGRTPEDWDEYIKATYTIKARANAINNEGFNETGAGDYILAKTFADAIPELKEALDIYDKFDIKTSEILKIEALYNDAIEDAKYFTNKVDRGSIYDEEKMIRKYAYEYLTDFNHEYMNIYNTERLQGDLWYAGSSPMQNEIWGHYYEKNGKYYDSKGNEIPPEQAAKDKAFITDYLDSLMYMTRRVSDMGYDWQKATSIHTSGILPTREQVINYENVGFDAISALFVGAMDFSLKGVGFQVATHLPIVGTWLEMAFNYVGKEIFQKYGMDLADMTGFSRGWDKDTRENYKEAVEGLGYILFARAKGKLWGKFKGAMSEKAITKAWKAGVSKYTDLLFNSEVEPLKIQDIIREKNALPKETGKKPTTRKEVEKQRNAEKTTESKIKIEGKEAEGEKVAGEKTEGTKKPMITTSIVKEALKEFNRVFEEEYQKENEGKGTNLMDDLFNKARDLYSQIIKERNVNIDAKLAELEKQVTERPETVEVKEAETVEPGKTEETVTVEEKTPETATQPTEETQVSETIETAPETPGVRVEEATTKAPADVEGKIETKESKAIEEKKTTINKILDFIQELQDTSVDVFNKIQSLYKKATEKSETKKIREREIQRQKDEQLLREAGLSNEEIELVMNNPFGETLLDVINAMTKEITDKKGKIKEVQKEMDLNNGEIQREVLADGVKEIQEYVDKLVDMKNKLGKLYEELSTDKKIDTTDFATSEELTNVLDGFKLELTEEIGEDLQIKTRVRKKGGGEMTAEQETIAKYVEAMIDNVIRRRPISEADAQAIRTKFDWKDDTVGSPSKAAKNSFRDAFNKFLDRQEGTDLLRKIDAGYSKISEAIKDLKEILTKDNQVKETAKNKILNWDEETLNQMEELVPGIKQLVELARKSPDIVKKGVASKMKTKETRRWLADPVRYTFVGLPTLVGATTGGVGGGVLGIILGSFIFKRSENLGGKLKGKIVKKAPDLKRFDAFVDNLSLSDKEKSAYKREVLDNIDKIREKLQGEREAEFNEIMAEVNKIIIDRKAGDILDKLSDTEPTPPEGPDGTPPSGGSAKAEEKITPMEQKIVEASLGKEEGETYSEKAETIANELLKLEKTVDDITTDYATEKLEERGEDVTPENIEKVKQEPEKDGDIMDFLRDMESDKQYTTDPTQPDYRKTDLDTLMEIAEHPEKYPNVNIEEVNDAIEYIIQKNTMAEMREGGGMRGSDINMEYTFAAEVDRVNGMEQRMADAKTPEAKENLKKEWIKAKEGVIEEIQQAYNIDQFEAADKFDQLSNASLRTIEEGNKTKNGYKGKHRVSKAEQDKLLALMGKGPSQNITYTSTSENIATMENPASRKRVAEQRIRQVVDPKLEKAKIGINKDKIARTTAKWQAEKEALENIIKEADEQMKPQQEALEQKKQIAEETKKLTEKRKNSKSREEKKELTKKIDENQDAFEKLTYEELGELYDKPDDVIEKEAKEAKELEGKEHLIDAGKYNPWKINIAEREIKHENPQEKDIWTDSNGEEITFYHGTPNGGFEEFDLGHRGESNDRVGPGDYGRGMYFTPFKETAEGYAKHSKAGSNKPEIYETKLRMENPLRLDLYMKYQKARRELDKKDLERGYNLISKEHGENVDRLLKEFGFTEELYDKYDELISAIGDNRMDFDIRAHGFDGIISENGKEVIIPDTKQIVVNKHYSTNPTVESLEYNKSKDPSKVELEVYKGVRGYGIEDTPGDPNTTFYTNDKSRADQYSKKPDAEKQTISLDSSKVKIIDSKGIKRNQKVDENGNVVEGQTSKKGSDNYIDYNNRKATEEGYDAVIYKGITDIGPYVHKGAKIAESADDIVLLKKEAPKKEAPKTEEKKVEEKKEPGSEPLMKIENDGYVYNEPMPGDLKTEVIFERMEYIRKKAKETKKLTQKESAEFAKLKDLYKRQLEWEAREKQEDMTDEELDNMYEKMYTSGPVSTAGIDMTPYTD